MMDRAQQERALDDLARRIAHGFADRIGAGTAGVEWVAVVGDARGPALGPDGPRVHRLQGGAGAFVLSAPGVPDLLFVVRARGAAFLVNISNSSRPWDPGERHAVRPGYVTDLRLMMESAARYARRASS